MIRSAQAERLQELTEAVRVADDALFAATVARTRGGSAIADSQANLEELMGQARSAFVAQGEVPAEIVERISREQSRLTLFTRLRRDLDTHGIEMKVQLAEARVAEGEATIQALEEQIEAHTQEQAKALAAVAELEGGQVTGQVTGPRSEALRAGLKDALACLDGLNTNLTYCRAELEVYKRGGPR